MMAMVVGRREGEREGALGCVVYYVCVLSHTPYHLTVMLGV